MLHDSVLSHFCLIICYILCTYWSVSGVCSMSPAVHEKQTQVIDQTRYKSSLNTPLCIMGHGERSVCGGNTFWETVLNSACKYENKNSYIGFALWTLANISLLVVVNQQPLNFFLIIYSNQKLRFWVWFDFGDGANIWKHFEVCR